MATTAPDMLAMVCPDCRSPLAALTKNGRCLWRCEGCRGQALTVPALTAAAGRPVVASLWAAANASPRGRRRCPSCQNQMRETAPEFAPALTLDVCVTCQIIWFDRGELEQLPQRESAGKAVPLEARRALAQARIEDIAATSRASGRMSEVLQEQVATRSIVGGRRNGYDAFDAVDDLLSLLFFFL